MDSRFYRNKGFTLIEVMIVVAVIGILAAIAYPSYQNSVLKAQRADAHESLLRIQQAQEKWRVNNATYTTDLADLNVNATSMEGYYTLSIDAGATGVGYTARASKTSGLTEKAPCNVDLTLVVNGASVTRAPAACW